MAERYIESAEELLRKQQEAEAMPPVAAPQQVPPPQALKKQGIMSRMLKRPADKGFDLDFDKQY